MIVDKPPVYSYGKAERRIAELEGQIIQLKLELQYLKEPHEVDNDNGSIRCGNCGYRLARNTDTAELLKETKLYGFCPVCGKKIKW